MAPKVGQFKFQRRYRTWGIYVIDSICNGIMTAAFVKSVATYEDAVRETYRLKWMGRAKEHLQEILII